MHNTPYLTERERVKERHIYKYMYLKIAYLGIVNLDRSPKKNQMDSNFKQDESLLRNIIKKYTTPIDKKK